MAMIESRDGVRMHVDLAGTEGAPAIIFLHGFAQSLEAWEEQFNGALDAFRLVRVDLRGHGASEKPESPESYTEGARWAGDVAAIIEHFNLVKPILVGWSYGGYIICDYIRQDGTANVGGIVLVAGGTKRGVPAARPFADPALKPIWAAVMSDDPEIRAQGTRDFVRACTAEPMDPATFERVVAENENVPGYVRRALMARPIENDDLLAQIDIPTLIVHGTRDAIILPAAAEHHATLIPGSRLVWYEGVGHAPFREAPERFNADLAAFARTASLGAGTVFG
jgi:pimeloyl-ACP methyl ester carboxylesterase